MGHSYTFSGEFVVEPPLTMDQIRYLVSFSETRRVKRDPRLLTEAPDPLRDAVGLPIGPDGCYFVGVERDAHGQTHRGSVLDVNLPPATQPGLWCQWLPNASGDRLRWDEGEKFYFFDDWLMYQIEHFFEPWGRRLKGRVHWQGDDEGDRGTLIVRDSVLDVLGAIAVRQADDVRRLSVFLCYASEDNARVRRLATRLRDDNVDVWMDDKKLLPGSDWELEIRRALRSTDAIVVCLSPLAVNKRGFVQRELRMVLAVADEQPEGELFVFPVRFTPCDVPESLRRWHWIDLDRRGAYSRLLAGLAARANSISQ